MNKRLLTCFLALMLVGQFLQVKGQVDSLYSILHSSDDEAKVEAYLALTEYFRNVNTDSALLYARKALDLAVSSNKKGKEIEALYNLGLIYRYKGDYEAADSRLNAGLKMAREENDTTYQAYILGGLGVVYYNQGAYEEAIDYYNEAISLSKEINDISSASLYNNIGLIYEEKGEYDEAIKYYEQLRDISVQLDNERGYATALNNIGHIYSKKGDYNTALQYFGEALDSRKAVGNERGYAKTLGYIGETYFKQGRYAEALSTLESSLRLKRENQDLQGEATTLQTLGELHLRLGNSKVALDHYLQGMSIADEINARTNLLHIYDGLWQLYEDLGDYQNAFQYQYRYMNLKDSIHNEELELKVNKMESRFELEKREKELELKEQDIQIKQLQIENNQFIIYLLIISVLLLGGLGALYFSRYRIRTRTNDMLRRQNEEIILQKEEIGNQRDKIAETQKIIEEKNEKLSRINLELEAKVQERTRELQKSYHDQLIVNQELDTLVYKTSHDIRGPLVSMKGLCNTALMEITDDTAKCYLQLLDKTSKQMNKILDRLISYNYIKNKLPEGEQVDVVSLIRKTKDSLANLDSYSDVTFFLDMPDDVKWFTDKQLITTIVENILENAIIFSSQLHDSPSKVKVKVSVEKNLLYVTVSDNGIGIPDDIKEQIFTMFFRGTERSSGSGMGLYISRLAIEKLGGDLRLDTEGQWTTFEIAIPQLYVGSQVVL
ncbi:tetratricopeptide repeat protein [Roseivirga sp. BDSF3-8]|uniref:tetratricopeptide repeat protein n=1 Tax=Roseivirga sp. BDSF3-8 TaxID=3241598 RepID=UPI003532244B